MRYAWNRGRSVDAQVVGGIVESIAVRSGGVCPPSMLVDEARPEESPLHSMFEWDDWAAAEGYRRGQARGHIRELRIVKQADDETELVQAFVHIVRLSGDTPVEGYRLTSLVVQSRDEYQQMLDEALSGLRAWKRRYEHLAELGVVLGAIDVVV